MKWEYIPHAKAVYPLGIDKPIANVVDRIEQDKIGRLIAAAPELLNILLEILWNGELQGTSQDKALEVINQTKG